MLVCIEGIDGSGKGTVTNLVTEKLKNEFAKTVATMSFPQYTKNTFGELAGKYLNGEFGKAHPYLVGTLFSLDRYESKYRLDGLVGGTYFDPKYDFVLLDRYTPSNVAYCAAKGTSFEEAQTFAEHFLWLEHGLLDLPLPAKIIYLDIDTKLAIENVAKKNARVYTDKTHDIHEADFNYLDRVNRFYRNDLSNLYADCLGLDRSRYITVKCSDENGLRSFDCIVSDILKSLELTTNG